MNINVFWTDQAHNTCSRQQKGDNWNWYRHRDEKGLIVILDFDDNWQLLQTERYGESSVNHNSKSVKYTYRVTWPLEWWCNSRQWVCRDGFLLFIWPKHTKRTHRSHQRVTPHPHMESLLLKTNLLHVINSSLRKYCEAQQKKKKNMTRKYFNSLLLLTWLN